MEPRPAKHWARPQAIQRGLLRVYILSTLACGPTSGYEIMQSIDEKTEGAWRPGPGTIYPLLKSLVREKLVAQNDKASGTSRVSYAITKSGSEELESMREHMGSLGRKERVVLRLVSDLIPRETLVQVLLARAREGSEFMRSKIGELPEPQRTAALKELVTISENLLDWARSDLTAKRTRNTKSRTIR